MDLIKTEIRNFMTIKEATLDLADKGLVLIQGVNEDESSADSNGAGKSTIPDAIFWCDYGETARGESGDAIINHKAKKDCRVQNFWRDGEIVYRISRYRKDATFKNATLIHALPYEDYMAGTGSWTDLSKGIEKETQLKINEIKGSSKEVFAASIYAGQENMPDLPRMTDKQLKTLIEEASGTERLEKAYVVAGRKALAAKTALDTVNDRVVRTETRIGDVWGKIRAAAADFKAFEDGREGAAAHLQHTLDGEIVHADSLKLQLAKFPAEEKLTAGIDGIKKKLASHGTYIEKQKGFQVALTAHERQLAVLQSDRSKAVKKVKDLQHNIEHADEEMSEPCPACGKAHTEDEVEDWRKHQQGLKVTAEEEMTTLMNAEKLKDELIVKLKGELADFIKTIPDVSDLVDKQTKLNAALASARNTQALINLSEEKQKRLRDAVIAAADAPNPHKSLLTSLSIERDKLKVELEEAKVKQVETNKELTVAEAVAKVFSPAGVRAHILDTVTPFLNDRTADYLSTLSDGSISAVWSTLGETAKGELREKFNIDVENNTGGKSFGLLSGGEKRKVRIATMLALQDLVAARATKPIKLWIGDEVDDALDPAGLERLMGIMEKKAKERGTVLVISHNELTDWIDNVATVTKKDGFSTVSGVLSV